MTLAGLLQLGIVLAIVVVGIVLARLVEGTGPLVEAPRWVQTLLGGLALGGPWVLYWNGLIETPVVDGVVLTLAIVLVLWLAAMKLTGIGMGSRPAC